MSLDVRAFLVQLRDDPGMPMNFQADIDQYLCQPEIAMLPELAERVADELPRLRERKHGGTMLPHGSATDCPKCIIDKVVDKLEAVLDGCDRHIIEATAARTVRCGDYGSHELACPLAIAADI